MSVKVQDQRDLALERANEVRVARMVLKAQIKAGEVSVSESIAFPPVFAERMQVRDVLLAARSTGPFRANRILARANLSQSKTLGALTARQRGELLDVLAGRV